MHVNRVAAALIIALLALFFLTAGYYLASESSSQNAYWTIDISPTSGRDLVTPNGTIRVQLNQSGITVTADATGINGFGGWNFDGQAVVNANSTIFVPKQKAYSNHTLEAQFIVGTPPLAYSSKLTGIGIPQFDGIFNASQSSTIQANLTLTSMSAEKITVPIEDLRMTYYNATVDYKRWVNNDYNYSTLQAESLNYSFSLNQLTLEPNMSNSTILTINVAQNATPGQYFFFIDFGDFVGTDFSYSSSINLGIVIETGTIDYWLDNTLDYQMVNGQWQTVNTATNSTSPGLQMPINARNDGISTASFDLIISFTNAFYGGSSAIPRIMIAWDKINDTSANYSFNLSPHQTQSINVSFAIDNNMNEFRIGLSFESNQSLLAEPSQKGSQPWEVVYRQLYFHESADNSYAPGLIS